MERMGDLLYWTASLVAVLIMLWVVWSYIVNGNSDEPIIRLVPLMFAGIIWLLARLFRSWLAES